MEPKDFLTVRQTAELLGMSTRSVYLHIRKGTLHAFMPRGFERGYRVTRQEVDRWLSEEWVPVK